MFYIAITASLTNLYIHGAREFPIPVSDLILGILFLHGWSQRAINSVAIGGWSVADEFSFYLIFPIIYRLMDNIKTSLVFLFISIAVFPLLSIAFYYWLHGKIDIFSPDGEYFSFLWPLIEIPVFMLGITIYHLRETIKPEINSMTKKIISYVCWFLAIGTLFLSMPTRNATLYLSSLGLAFFVLGLSLNPIRIIVNKYTEFLGKISYSAYLKHMFPIIIIHNLTVRVIEKHFQTQITGTIAYFIVLLISTILLTTLASNFTYKNIELTGINYGRRLIIYLNTHQA